MPIQEVAKIWINGEMVDWKEAKIHVLTHALHYGSGVFEGIRCYKTKRGPAVFRLKEHLERLANSARLYFMELPYSIEELSQATKDLIRANGLDACYIRPIAFRGYGEMGLNPLKAPVEVAIAVWPWGTYLGEEGLKNGIRVKTSSFQRIHSNVLPPQAKATGQYANSILAKVEALEAGYDEALLLDYRGFLSEGPGENLFLVKKGTLYTPPAHASILVGITRDTVITLAREAGYPVMETDLTREVLYTADEAFFTGTAAEVTPIRKVDAYDLGGPGPITRDLQKRFFAVINGEDPRHEAWLDRV
jgi:branched-chain amino acid aminotransferase